MIYDMARRMVFGLWLVAITLISSGFTNHLFGVCDWYSNQKGKYQYTILCQGDFQCFSGNYCRIDQCSSTCGTGRAAFCIWPTFCDEAVFTGCWEWECI